MAFDLRNFIIHSGYPIDKVIAIKSGSYLIKNQNELSDTLYVAHGLPGKALGITVFSNYSDFRDTYDEGYPQYVNPGEYGMRVRVTNSNIEITGWNQSNNNYTVYWRTFLLESSETSYDVKYTAVDADIFQFNSEYNYSKLVKEGVVTSTTTITHGVNFVPQTLIWMDNGTWIERLTSVNNANKAAEFPDNTTILLRPGSTGVAGVSKLHYRIYGDD